MYRLNDDFTYYITINNCNFFNCVISNITHKITHNAIFWKNITMTDDFKFIANEINGNFSYHIVNETRELFGESPLKHFLVCQYIENDIKQLKFFDDNEKLRQLLYKNSNNVNDKDKSVIIFNIDKNILDKLIKNL